MVALSSVSPLQLRGKSEGTLNLAEGASGAAVFQAKANKAMGAAKLRVVVSAGSLQSREELLVPFAPAGLHERRTKTVELSQIQTEVSPLLQGWVPTTEKSTLWVTTNPYGESFSHLK